MLRVTYQSRNTPDLIQRTWPELDFHVTPQTRDIDTMLEYYWPTVSDGEPTFNQRWVNFSCLLWIQFRPSCGACSAGRGSTSYSTFCSHIVFFMLRSYIYYIVAQIQTAVTACFSSKQLLPFGFLLGFIMGNIVTGAQVPVPRNLIWRYA